MLHILTQWLSTHVGDNISKSAFVDVIDFEDILLRIGSWSFGWNQLKRIFIPVIIQHSQKLFFNGSSRITQSVANNSPVGDSSIMCLRLLFSLPFGLEVLRLLQLVLASLMASLGSSLELSTITNLAWVKGQTELSTQSPFLQLVGTWILLLTNFVPISLVVSLELVKFWQAMFM